MASANPQDTRNWRDWIQEDPGTAGHLIVKPPLKPVKPLPWSHMMAKRGDLFSQSPWIGGNLVNSEILKAIKFGPSFYFFETVFFQFMKTKSFS